MDYHQEIIGFFKQDEFTDNDLNELRETIRRLQLSSVDLETAFQFIEANLKVFEAIQRKDIETYFGSERTGKRKRIFRKGKSKSPVVTSNTKKNEAKERSRLNRFLKTKHNKSGKQYASGYKPGKTSTRMSPGVYGKMEKLGPGKIIYIRMK